MSNLTWNMPGYTPVSSSATQIAGIEKEAAEKKLNIAKILSISSNLKAIHVKTKRGFVHNALDQAFEDLNEKLDEFNECVQGYYIRKNGKRLDLKNQEIKFILPGDEGIIGAVKQLEDDFTLAAKPLVSGVTPLEGLQDDVLNCFYQLYYRLDFHG